MSILEEKLQVYYQTNGPADRKKNNKEIDTKYIIKSDLERKPSDSIQIAFIESIKDMPRLIVGISFKSYMTMVIFIYSRTVFFKFS